MRTPAIPVPAARDEWQRANRLYLDARFDELKARLSVIVPGRSASESEPEIDVSITARLCTQREKAVAAGRVPALDLLSEMFGLSPREQDVLLMSLAPDLDDSFTSIFGSGTDRRRRASLSLALALHERNAEEESLANCLLPGRPLRRFALVRSVGASDLNPWSLGAALYCDERMAAYVRGVNIRESRLVQILRPAAEALEAPTHADVIAEIAHSLSPGGGDWPVIRIAAAFQADAMEAAQAAAHRAEITLVILDLAQLAERRAEWEELFALLARESALNRLAYWIGDIGTPPDPSIRAAGDRVLEELEAPLLFFAGASFGSEAAGRTIALPKLDRVAQRSAWEKALATIPNSVNGELDRITQQFDFGPGDIRRALQVASNRTALPNRIEGAIVSGEDLWRACRDHAAMHLGELARRIEPCFNWDDIVVPSATMSQIREIAAQVHQRSRVYEKWGFGQKLTRGRGISVLFCGSSGTGKTMAAEVIARHLCLDLYRIDLSGVVNKYLGETEKNLRRVFDSAEQSGAILFFDEADALFGNRTEVRDSHDRYANIEVNYLLQRMEEYSGLAILATNRKHALDQAFLRRLRFVVDFPFPDAEHRRRIWQRAFPPAMQADGLDFSTLSRLEVPGGNIRSISLNAAFLAAGEDSQITTLHVMRAAAREYTKIDRGISTSEFGQYAEAVRR